MNRMTGPCVLALVAVALSFGAAAAGDVNINIGAPPVVVAPPTVVVAAPPVVRAAPPVVVVPGTPVYSVPTVSFNLFVYRDRYYSFHNDAWFVAVSPGAPWVRLAIDRVPEPVRLVPVKYYKVPPGHAKKWKHARHEDEREYEVERHEGGRGCPPGLARQGRC